MVTDGTRGQGRGAQAITLACCQLVVLVTLLHGIAILPAPACGPDFPNNLLDAGDAALLVAPLASFADELKRMNLVTSRFQAKPPHNQDRVVTHRQQSLAAEVADLRTALQQTKPAEADIERICTTHQLQREKLNDYAAARERWRNSGSWVWDEHDGHCAEPKSRAPEFPVVEYAEGLPAEFADYLEGFSAWHNPALMDKDMARQAWERLLARPAAERRFKSTWAAYMLGRSWEEDDAAKAIDYYQQTRQLLREVHVDSLGLAAASLGREARVQFERGALRVAMGLYLEQHATGDPTAVNSLRRVAAAALGNPEGLRELAADALSQRVITAYVVSGRRAAWTSDRAGLVALNDVTVGWLSAVEAAGVNDVEAAEKLALAAYQAGAFDTAQRWIRRAKPSPLTQWLQAKLHLRAGKVDEAAALLIEVTRQFPLAVATNAPKCFAHTLRVDREADWSMTVGQQALGELGALRLARREYTAALDALVRSGYWMDAAFVAEAVLTTDELQAYVDRVWPPVTDIRAERDLATDPAEQRIDPGRTGANLRHLLARRLTRESRGHQAQSYYPEDLRPEHAAFLQALEVGWDENRPADERARNLFGAGRLARFRGMELLGTELAPDWHVHGGNYECGFSLNARATQRTGNHAVASDDELRRTGSHRADPDVRFHYRYQGAFLAWEAAKLMPDNNDETARVLCEAGSWIKYLDPPTADLFYKALVRRCRQTAIGEQADRLRWFPVLDQIKYPESP